MHWISVKTSRVFTHSKSLTVDISKKTDKNDVSEHKLISILLLSIFFPQSDQ
jgi:hypothetical protein